MTPVPRSFQCPNCGAQLHPDEGARTVTCEFCGATSPLATPAPSRPAGERIDAPRATGGTTIPWSRVALVLVPVGAVAVWLALRKDAPPPVPAAASSAPIVAATDASAAVPTRKATVWHVPPIVADVNDDGVEDIVGQWDDDNHCTTGLIDGKTRRVSWSIAHGMSCQYAFQPFALASSTLVLAPGNTPAVELYALPAGTDIGRVDLDREPTHLLGNGHEVWVDLSGGEALVDTTSKTVAPAWATRVAPRGATRPAWVRWVPAQGLLLPGHYNTPKVCSPSPCWDASFQRPVPPIPDMVAWDVLIEDGVDAAIVVGTTARGTQLPMVAGFSVASKTVAWTHAFGTPETALKYAPTSAVLAQHTLYVEYGTKDSAMPDSYARSRLAALSATTGELLWDVAIDDDRDYAGGDRIVVGAWIYLPLAHSLELRDPRSGALVAQLP
jgi:hypothetical protein